VNERLQTLLDTIRELSPPVGPNPAGWAERDRREVEWCQSLSVDDYLLLLDWMIDPRRPPDRDAGSARAPSANNAAYFVGRAARNCRDERLLSRLLDLLADSVHGGPCHGHPVRCVGIAR